MSKNSYLSDAKKLKALGYINYDLRSKLNRGQKSYITKKATELKQFFRKPDEFHSTHVGKAKAKTLRKSGYEVSPCGRAIIQKDGYSSVSIDKNSIKYSKRGQTEKVILSGSKEFHKKLERLTKVPLKHNQMITLKIGNSPSFHRARFSSMEELTYYLNNDMDFHAPRDVVIPKMSVVTISTGKEKALSKRAKKQMLADWDFIDGEYGE